MIKLVATDLDGTLLRSDSSVSPRTRAALEAAEAAGLVVVFVTGRPPRWLDDVVEQTGHLGVAVGANGAVIYDLHDEHVVRAHTLEPEVAQAVAADVRAGSRRSVTPSSTSTGSRPKPTTCTTGRSIPTTTARAIRCHSRGLRR